jgi:hypothetical protein
MNASYHEKKIKSIIKSPNSSSISANGDSPSKKKVKFLGGTIYFFKEKSSKKTEGPAFNNETLNKALNIPPPKENIKLDDKLKSF